MAAVPYFDLVREMTNAYNHRLRLVQHARQHGIKPAARAFTTTVLTVRKWLRRFQQHGPSGLREHSRAHRSCPHKTSLEIEQQVLALRQKLPTFGAARLKREFDLPVSHMAIQRIWRQHGLIRPRRKKYQRKQDLAAVKATWRLFQQISADTKDLCDIPRFWPQAQRLRLPLVEYTAREVRSGLLFWAFAQKRSAAASAVFAARIQQHLDRWGVNLRDLAWQTDNGSEFIGGHDPHGQRTGFPAALGDSQHLRIPPAAHTYQSDVETVHRLVEDEFFDLETFASRGEFLAKAQTYQHYFNLARPNSHKENQTPWQIIERLAPRSPLQLCLLPPVFLDYYLNDAGVQPYPGPGWKWQISTAGGDEPAWNPNGRELFYRAGEKMMAADITTQPVFAAGKPRILFEGHQDVSHVGISSYDVPSDGQRFLMLKTNEQESAPTQISVVLNWFEELKQKGPTGKE